jgi:hypothetical protein
MQDADSPSLRRKAVGRRNADHAAALDAMASPHQPDNRSPDVRANSTPVSDGDQPPILRLRLTVWDVVCTVAILTVVFVIATTTSWPSLLFGFLNDVCTGDTCAPVPYGVDYFIYPVMWGGIGAAFAAAILGPFVSLIKGWYMFFWPLLAIALIFLSSLAGYAMTAFCEHYWH